MPSRTSPCSGSGVKMEHISGSGSKGSTGKLEGRAREESQGCEKSAEVDLEP